MPRFRPTARLIVLDPSDRVLLFSAQDPRGRFWFTPGGGVRAGESLAAAAARELAEETGLRAEPGPVVATSAGLWSTPDGELFFGADSYFLVRVSEPSVDTSGQELLERSIITGYRWWTAEQIRASRDPVFPVGLDGLMDLLLKDGMPNGPVRLPWRL